MISALPWIVSIPMENAQSSDLIPAHFGNRDPPMAVNHAPAPFASDTQVIASQLMDPAGLSRTSSFEFGSTLLSAITHKNVKLALDLLDQKDALAKVDFYTLQKSFKTAKSFHLSVVIAKMESLPEFVFALRGTELGLAAIDEVKNGRIKNIISAINYPETLSDLHKSGFAGEILKASAEYGRMDIAESLLKNEDFMKRIKDNDVGQAFQRAIIKEHVSIAKLFLDNPALMKRVPDAYIQNPYQAVVAQRLHDHALLFLEHDYVFNRLRGLSSLFANLIKAGKEEDIHKITRNPALMNSMRPEEVAWALEITAGKPSVQYVATFSPDALVRAALSLINSGKEMQLSLALKNEAIMRGIATSSEFKLLAQAITAHDLTLVMSRMLSSNYWLHSGPTPQMDMIAKLAAASSTAPEVLRLILSSSSLSRLFSQSALVDVFLDSVEHKNLYVMKMYFSSPELSALLPKLDFAVNFAANTEDIEIIKMLLSNNNSVKLLSTTAIEKGLNTLLKDHRMDDIKISLERIDIQQKLTTAAFQHFTKAMEGGLHLSEWGALPLFKTAFRVP